MVAAKPPSYLMLCVCCCVRVLAVDESYLRWVDRMRIPPKVERHPLDFDWPTLEERILKKKAPPFTAAAAAAAAERVVTCVEVKLPHEHPRGPYIDLGLAEHMSRDAFEESVLKHFEVVDMTTWLFWWLKPCHMISNQDSISWTLNNFVCFVQYVCMYVCFCEWLRNNFICTVCMYVCMYVSDS